MMDSLDPTGDPCPGVVEITVPIDAGGLPASPVGFADEIADGAADVQQSATLAASGFLDHVVERPGDGLSDQVSKILETYGRLCHRQPTKVDHRQRWHDAT